MKYKPACENVSTHDRNSPPVCHRGEYADSLLCALPDEALTTWRILFSVSYTVQSCEGTQGQRDKELLRQKHIDTNVCTQALISLCSKFKMQEGRIGTRRCRMWPVCSFLSHFVCIVDKLTTGLTSFAPWSYTSFLLPTWKRNDFKKLDCFSAINGRQHWSRREALSIQTGRVGGKHLFDALVPALLPSLSVSLHPGCHRFIWPFVNPCWPLSIQSPLAHVRGDGCYLLSSRTHSGHKHTVTHTPSTLLQESRQSSQPNKDMAT